MNLPAYRVQRINPLIFTFISKGKKGEITKVVRYDLIDGDVFNLGFGDLASELFDLDDSVNSNNGDIVKVVATVIQTLPLFFEKYPDKVVLFSGSDQRRTDFYSRIIVMHHLEFKNGYIIKGVTFDNEIKEVRAKVQYQYFIVEKK